MVCQQRFQAIAGNQKIPAGFFLPQDILKRLGGCPACGRIDRPRPQQMIQLFKGSAGCAQTKPTRAPASPKNFPKERNTINPGRVA